MSKNKKQGEVRHALDLVTQSMIPVKAQREPAEVKSALQMVRKTINEHEDCNNNLNIAKKEIQQLKTEKFMFASEASKMVQNIEANKIENIRLNAFSLKTLKEKKELETEKQHLQGRVTIVENELTETKEKLAKTEEKLAKTEEKLAKTEEKLDETINEQRTQREIIICLGGRLATLEKANNSNVSSDGAN